MTKDKIYTMAIESSCDETAVAILENGRKVLSNIVSTQIDIHKEFGGVVPEIASRKHIESIIYLIDKALEESGKTFRDISNIGVTYGPGLVGALLVGLSVAKAIAFARNIPLTPVNHIEGHIYANFISYPDLEPPFTCLIVSGGHTNIINMRDYGDYEVLGTTLDDAAGEAFDKVARTLGLGYPGGPKIDKLAQIGDSESIKFPRVKLKDDDYDFSFSGLKSSVLNYVNQQKQKDKKIDNADIAASFQAAAIEVLVEKTIRAAKETNMNLIAVAGGVAANQGLRDLMSKRSQEEGIDLKIPPRALCTDNAAMIASVAYYNYIRGIEADMSINAVPNLKLKGR
ncbi:MAG: tRNA (adenosine(37)-N6)-threonylcarbamoyltransferase complex transferase subunit TsaD [Andreesenia angusta]|nr:tRNA (adenosine(37)-N6)-threonylcarbamoyltransferase complex transferase subunit TsaD [Andreesenia angusta]